MATQKQVFTEAHENIDKANHTTSGLIEYLRYIFGKLENATGGGGGGSEVSYTQKLTSGSECGTITIDGDSTKIYAPEPTAPTEVEVTQVIATGTKIATISVDDVSTDIYAPANGGGHTLLKSVTADGTKTYAQILSELSSELSRITSTSYLEIVKPAVTNVIPVANYGASEAAFNYSYIYGTNLINDTATIAATGSFKESVGTAVSDSSSTVVASGYIFNLYA